MTFKSHIPFFTVPFSLVLLSILLVDAACGNFDSSKDIPRYVIWSLWGGYSLVSGLIRWNRPYVMTDDKGLTIYGRQFSNQPTKEIPWDSIQSHIGRSFGNIRLKMADGETIKIPINGMSGKAVTELLALIDRTKMRNANHALTTDVLQMKIRDRKFPYVGLGAAFITLIIWFEQPVRREIEWLRFESAWRATSTKDKGSAFARRGLCVIDRVTTMKREELLAFFGPPNENFGGTNVVYRWKKADGRETRLAVSFTEAGEPHGASLSQ